MFYLDARYEEKTKNICKMQNDKVGEVAFSKKDAEYRCNNIPGCTMYYQYYDSITETVKFSTCPVGSRLEASTGHTVYTRKGRIIKCTVICSTSRMLTNG